MKKIQASPARAVSLPGVVIFTLVYNLLVGLQGITPGGMQQLMNARRVGNLLTSAKPGSSWFDTLSSASPGVDLIGGIALAISPAWHGRTLWALGLTASLIAVALLWRLLDERAGKTSAATACLLLVANPITTAESMTLTGTWPVIAMWLATWVLATERRQTWWKTGALWFVGALWLLSWPWMLLWCALLLWSNARTRQAHDEDELPGMIPSSWFSLGLLAAPLLVPLLAMAIHPGFWSNPKEALAAFGAANFLPSARGVGLAGSYYEAGRLPLYAGAWWIFQHTPFFILGAAMWKAWSDVRNRTQSIPMTLESLAMMTLFPWLIPGGHLGAVDSSALALVPLAVLAAPAITLASKQTWKTFDKRQAIMAHGAGIMLLFAPLALSLATYFPYNGAWRGALSGGAIAAVQRGETQPREPLLSIGALQAFIEANPGCSIYAPDNAVIVQEYTRAGLLPDVFVPGLRGSTHTLSMVPRQNKQAPPVRLPDTSNKKVTPLGPGDLPLFILVENAVGSKSPTNAP